MTPSLMYVGPGIRLTLETSAECVVVIVMPEGVGHSASDFCMVANEGPQIPAGTSAASGKAEK